MRHVAQHVVHQVFIFIHRDIDVTAPQHIRQREGALQIGAVYMDIFLYVGVGGDGLLIGLGKAEDFGRQSLCVIRFALSEDTPHAVFTVGQGARTGKRIQLPVQVEHLCPKQGGNNARAIIRTNAEQAAIAAG